MWISSSPEQCSKWAGQANWAYSMPHLFRGSTAECHTGCITAAAAEARERPLGNVGERDSLWHVTAAREDEWCGNEDWAKLWPVLVGISGDLKGQKGSYKWPCLGCSPTWPPHGANSANFVSQDPLSEMPGFINSLPRYKKEMAFSRGRHWNLLDEQLGGQGHRVRPSRLCFKEHSLRVQTLFYPHFPSMAWALHDSQQMLLSVYNVCCRAH